MSVIDHGAVDFLGSSLQTAHTFGEHPTTIEEKVDALIIGAGPSGLVVGTILAEAGLEVVIVEAGRFWRPEWFKRKQSWAAKQLMQEQATRVMTGNAFVPVASGRGVGGGTLVNSAICFRAPEWVLDEWVEDWGVDYFANSEREALFSEVEERIGVAPTPSNVAGENSEIARQGFAKLGGVHHGYMPRNAPGCVGCGTCQTGCPVGGKATADLTWLPRFLRAGGRLYADTRAEEIDVDDKTVRGARAVMVDPDSRTQLAEFEFRAHRTILAAGAINTALLLLEQNLANSSGQVGQNLWVHPTCGAVANFPNREVKLWSGATQGYYAYHPRDREILLETFSASPDVFLAQMATVGDVSPGQFLRQFKHLAACGLLLRDSRPGRVRPGRGGARINYRITQRDVDRFKIGLYTIIDMFHEAGSRAIRPMVAGSRFFAHKRDARDWVRRHNSPKNFSLYSSHPMGTCRIGTDPGRAVVRPEDGRTHDLEGLHVVDSSLFPTAMGANPQITIMAQALALGRRIAES